MNGWYRDLASDAARTRQSFDYDYSDLRPVLNTLSGAIIDIGGGLGVARHFVSPDSQYVVVEPSLAWLDPVWSALDDQFDSLHADVDLIIGVGENLPVRSGSFDAALALWSLNHTRNAARTIKEASRVLRPHGRLIVVLEEIAPTDADLAERPDLGWLRDERAVQPDHTAFSEAEFGDYIKDDFTVAGRRWIKHYLLIDLVKADRPGNRRSTGPAGVTTPGHDGDDAQVSWWDAWFTSRGMSWTADFEARISTDAPLQQRIASQLEGAAAVSILDVGSGPVSRAGRRHPSLDVQITSVDPLADQYRALLAAHGYDPSLGPIRGEAENLDQLFPANSFDVVNMENALDHCRDPIKAVEQLLKVVKAGGSVLLLHEENQADATGYAGACQWNLTETGGRVLLWNLDETIDLSAQLADRAVVTARRSNEPDYREPLEVAIRKIAPRVRPSSPSTCRATPGPAPRRRNLGALAWTLVRTDFKIRYHGSIGGFAWALLRPLSLFFVLQMVFSLIFTTDARYRVNLIVGLFLWEFFVEATRSGLGALASKAELLTKVKVPAWLLVVCSTANAVVMLGIFVGIIFAYLAALGEFPTTARLLLFMAYLFQFYAIVLGFGLAASVLFLRFRDVNQLWDLTTQVGFFAAPIIYPLGILPERVHVYLYLWPPTPVIQFARDVLVAGVVPSLTAHVLLFLASSAALAVGGLIFTRSQRRAVEYL